MSDIIVNYFEEEVHIERQKMVCFNCGLIKIIEFEFDPSNREFVRNDSEIKRYKNIKNLKCECPDCYSKAKEYDLKGSRYKKTAANLRKYGVMKNILLKASPNELFKSITQLKNVDDINYKKSDLVYVLMYMSGIEELEKYALMAGKWFGYTEPYNIIKILEKMIPKKFYHKKYKGLNEKSIDAIDKICNYFKISIQEAKEYVTFIEEQDKVEEFMSLFEEGGYKGKTKE